MHSRKEREHFSAGEVTYAERLIETFLRKLRTLPREIFSVTDRVRFNIAFFECTFRALCEEAFRQKDLEMPEGVTTEAFNTLKQNEDFKKALRFSTGQTSNVKLRYNKAKEILLA